jgi:hypothetical protein
MERIRVMDAWHCKANNTILVGGIIDEFVRPCECRETLRKHRVSRRCGKHGLKFTSECISSFTEHITVVNLADQAGIERPVVDVALSSFADQTVQTDRASGAF